MAKVTEMPEMLSSDIDATDIIYIVDHSGDEYKSKHIKYGDLVHDISLSIGLNAITNVAIGGDKLSIEFELKNKQTKTVVIDLSSIVNIYEGDGTYISIDDSTRTVHLNVGNVSRDLTLSSYGICDVSGQLSAYPYFGSNGIKVENYTISLSNSYLTSNALDQVSSNWNGAYSVVSNLVKLSSVIKDNTLALSSLNDLQGDNIVYDKTNKRLSVQYYVHPTQDSHTSGLYKITVDSMGHVTSAISVQKSDITNLGIPGQDTTYSAGNGLKLEGAAFSVSADYALTSDLSTYGGSDSISVGGEGTSKTINVKADANGHIAITKNGLSVGNYIVHDDVKNKLALSSRDQLNIPTKVSDLTNDLGFINSHQQLKTINNIAISGSGNLGFLSSDTQFITINGISVIGSGSLELLSSYDYSTISSGIGLGNYALTSSLSTYGGSDSISVGGDGTSKTIDVKLNPNGNIVSTKEGLSVKESIGKEYLFNSNGFQTTTDKKTPSQISVSLKLGSNLTCDSDGKLSAGGGSNYNSGNGISIDNSNNINVIVADDGKLSFSDNKLSVGDFISQVTFISWFES